MRGQLRLGSALWWSVALALALAAPILYLAWPGDVSWWLAPLLVVPLIGLAEWRRERHKRADDTVEGGDGPWWPPADHPGL